MKWNGTDTSQITGKRYIYALLKTPTLCDRRGSNMQVDRWVRKEVYTKYHKHALKKFSFNQSVSLTNFKI
jgi:hypothetical protein